MKFFHQLQPIRDFSASLARHFINDRCPESAGALAYTSLLSLVPLMAVGFTLFAAFPAFNGFLDKAQDFIFGNFMPENAEAIQAHLRGFVGKASALTLPSLAALLGTALLSMATIDQTLNRIWKVRRQRSLVNAFIVYWAVLTLGPILIGVSLAITSYVASLPFLHDAVQPSKSGMFVRVLPFFAATLAFTLLYAIVPYRRIPLYHAMAGGVVAAALFELAKKGFTLFVTRFSTYEAIYGALAAVPIFLIWIYVSWLIILLGAEFTYCLGNRISGESDPIPNPGVKKSDVSPPAIPAENVISA